MIVLITIHFISFQCCLIPALRYQFMTKNKINRCPYPPLPLPIHCQCTMQTLHPLAITNKAPRLLPSLFSFLLLLPPPARGCLCMLSFGSSVVSVAPSSARPQSPPSPSTSSRGVTLTDWVLCRGRLRVCTHWDAGVRDWCVLEQLHRVPDIARPYLGLPLGLFCLLGVAGFQRLLFGDSLPVAGHARGPGCCNLYAMHALISACLWMEQTIGHGGGNKDCTQKTGQNIHTSMHMISLGGSQSP